MRAEVEKFLVQSGVTLHRGAMEFWAELESSPDRHLATDVEGVLQRRRQGVSREVDVDLLFGSLGRLRSTLDALAPYTLPLLTELSRLSESESSGLGHGDVLDLGCGGGAVACFLAWLRPDRRVVGVDRSTTCLDTARSLAVELGLSNVAFVVGDIASIDLGRTFGAIVSSAVWAETGDSATSESWLSTINELPVRMGDDGNPLAGCVARHLSADGTYVSLERCRDVAALGSWIGSLQSCGIVPDLGASRMVDVDGVLTGLERLPMIVARRKAAPVSVGAVLDWRLAHGNPGTEREIGTELDVALGGPWTVVAGEVLEVDDAMGSMTAALCLMEHGSSGLLYFTTTRGVREILARTTEGGAAQFVPMYRSVRNSVGRRPSVRSRRPFDDSDVEAAVPSLTFSWER